MRSGVISNFFLECVRGPRLESIHSFDELSNQIGQAAITVLDLIATTEALLTRAERVSPLTSSCLVISVCTLSSRLWRSLRLWPIDRMVSERSYMIVDMSGGVEE